MSSRFSRKLRLRPSRVRSVTPYPLLTSAHRERSPALPIAPNASPLAAERVPRACSETDEGRVRRSEGGEIGEEGEEDEKE